MADGSVAGLSPQQLDRLVQRLRRPGAPAAEGIPRRPAAGGAAPLSPAQERLWFLEKLAPGTAVYNVAGALDLDGALRPGALAAALSRVAERHEVLRSRFEERGGAPVQVPRPAVPVPLPWVDLAALPAGRRGGEARRVEAAAARTPFDLGRDPLLRPLLVRLADQRHVLSLTLHHLVADAWSCAVLVREVAALYAAAADGAAPGAARLDALPIQYTDYAEWQRRRLAEGALDGELDAWRRLLAGAELELRLPADHPRPPAADPRGARQPLALDAATVAGLRELARRHGTTLFAALLGVYAAVLGRYAGQHEVVVASPVAHRDRPELAGLIGFLVNTLALRTDLAGDPSFAALLERLRGTVAEATANQEVPFGRVVEALAPERSLSRSPLSQAMLAVETEALDVELAGLAASYRDVGTGTAKTDLLLTLRPAADGGFEGYLEHSAALFEPDTVERIARLVERLAADAARRPEAALSALAPLAAEERTLLLERWGDGGEAGRGEGGGGTETVVSRFRHQSAARPDAVAVVDGALHVTYGELDRRCAGAAAELLAAGVAPGERVGLEAERGAAALVAILGILRAGAAFVPLDPSYPAARRAAMATDAGLERVVAAGAVRCGADGGDGAPALRRLALSMAPAAGPVREPAIDRDALAYVMFTSGSTGRPKAVAVPHRAVVRLVGGRFAGFGPEESFVLFAPLSFDASTLEIWGALLHGGRVEVAPPGVLSAADLGAFVAERRATTLWLTAGLFHHAAQGDLAPFASLRDWLAGGDVLLPEPVRRVLAALPGCRLVNGYGPTENTTFTCCGVHERPEDVGEGGVAIGRPVAGTRVAVLDGALRPVPRGAVGELWTGGEGLAWGYLGQPARTAERFLPDPLSAEPGQRLYRTGDLVRWARDGRLHFLGRADQQVKVRGFRIEPAEVEAALGEHPAVGQCVVVARGASAADKRLVAYWVAAEDAAAQPLPEADRLAAHLRERVAPYMVPSAFVRLDALPLTPNDKVDRRALPEPDWTAARERRIPRQPGEETVAGVLAEVLGAGEALGPEDDFFAAGGHSLLAMRAAHRLGEAFGVEVPLAWVFEAPTAAGLAQRLVERAAPPALPPIVPREAASGEPAPLSFEQERLWFLEQLAPGTALNNIPAAVRLRGRLDPAVLERALERLAARHPALRTRFAAEGGRPVQRVADAGAAAGGFRLPRLDLGPLPPGAFEAAALRQAERLAREPLDLERGPVWRSALLALRPEDHLLVLVVHHLVADGWSVRLLLEDLAALHAATAAGEPPPPLPEPAISPLDHAAWQRRHLAGAALEERLAWWRAALDGAPQVLDLPLDRPRPPVRRAAGRHLAFAWPRGLAAAVERLARDEGTTGFTVLLAAFGVLLGRHAERRDVVVGAPMANRSRRVTARLVGFLANTVALRVRWQGDPSFRELVAGLRAPVLGAAAHQDLPFGRLVEELAPERDPARTPLFQAMLALREDVAPPRFGAAAAELVELSSATSKFDLTLFLTPSAQGYRGLAEYASDLFDETTVRRLLGHLERLLAVAVAAPDTPLAALPLLSPAERHQVLAEWAAAPAAEAVAHEGRGAATLHGRVAAQALRTPERVAVVAAGTALIYGELVRRAGDLAARLRAAGVRPGDRVAVCVERGVELPVALLGVLASGAAYVPLDPAYPAERNRFLLADAAVAALVADRRSAERLPETSVPRLEPAGEDGGAGAGGQAAFESVPGEALAYVIYTSGSTGRPKGVAISHANALALVAWAERAFPAAEVEEVLAATSVCFDLSVFELFVPLARGGRVVVAADALALPSLPEASGVTLVNTVPSAMAELARLDALPRSVRAVNLAGEALAGELVRRLHATAARPRVLNLYGPSEDTTYSTGAAIPRGEAAPPIGRPVDGTRAWVVDRAGRPVPAGVAGELLLAGDGVARGYLGRPALTAERFVPDPFSGVPGARAYRTGDRVRHRADGSLLFLGRIDHQVKLRGFRIELGEVEAALAAHPAVREAAAAVAEVAGDRRLVAWIGAAEGRPPEPSALRAWLAERLPAPMVPARLVVLPALPRTPNGKLDRAALPAPAADDAPPSAVPPRTIPEQVVAQVWRELLGSGPVGAHDDFFRLGGHSLLAVRMVARLRDELGVELPLAGVFERPTVAGVAALLTEAAGAAVPLAAGAVEGDHPLTPAQQRLWFLDRLAPGDPAYNLPVVVELTGALEPAALAAALAGVVERQAALRTAFGDRDGEPFQRVLPALAVPLPLLDLAALPEAARRREAERLAHAEAFAPFDLERPPLVRLRLLRLAGESWRLLVTAHHAIADGWSMRLLVRELAAGYAARRGERPEPAPPRVQYVDHARWLGERLRGDAAGDGAASHGRELAAARAWWLERFRQPPPPVELPTDRPRGAASGGRGGRSAAARRAGRETVLLSAAETAAVHAAAREEGVSPFVLLLAPFALLVARHAGVDDVTVGSPVAGRRTREAEGLVGVFLNTLALRTDLAGAATFREVLHRVRDTVLGALAHQDLPFEEVLDALQPERDLARPPLFQVMFNMLSFPQQELSVAGLEIEELEAPDVGAKFDLTVYVRERGEATELSWVHDAGLFSPRRVREMAAQYRALLARVVAAPQGRLDELSLLPEDAPPAGPGRAPLPAVPQVPVPVRFAEAARRHPDRVAVSDARQSISYAALDRASAALAAGLVAGGLAPGGTVAVHAHRAAELAVAALAVLRARGVLLLLDAAHPAARLAATVAAARPAAFLRLVSAGEVPAALAGALDGPLEGAGVELRLDVAPCGPYGGEEHDPGAAPPPPADDEPAHLMFTSGTTGRPRGIVAPHRPLAHFLDWYGERFAVGEADRFSMLSGLAHDPLLRDLFAPLTLGATLVVPDPERLAEPGWLAAWMARERVTVCHLTPALSRLLTGDDGGAAAPRPLPLKHAFFGGDVLTAGHVEALRRRAPRVACVNFYGTTETPQAVAWSPVGDDELARGRVPVGRGIRGVELLVLAGDRPCAPGELGEVCVRTPYLATGYLGDDELTRRRFVANPLSGRPGDRVYRTGDLGRYLPDGRVELAGRGDAQVNLRGFRLELAEVETALAAHPRVAAAAARTAPGTDGEPRLYAWFVAAGAEAPDEEELRRFLAERLPGPMLPDRVLALRHLPLTPNGKLDRAALPVPAPEAAAAAPRTRTEAELAEIWKDVLAVERVDPGANFFALGGHSLLATRLVARLRRAFGVSLPLRRLFEEPTLAELARRIEELRAARDEIDLPSARPDPERRHEPFALTEIQQAYWVGRRGEVELGGVASHRYFEVEGELDVERLGAAWRRLVARHDMLRAVVTPDGRQRILPAVPEYEIPVEDLRGLGDEAVNARLAATRERLSHQVLDPERWPLFEIHAARLSGERVRLFFSFDYLIADAWSFQILLRELVALYTGAAEELAPLELSFRDYVVAHEALRGSAVYRRAREYWVERLEDLPPGPRLPLAPAAPAAASGAAHRFVRRAGRLEPEAWRRLESRAAGAGTTASGLLVAAFSEVLAAWSAEPRFSLVLTLFNRLPFHPAVDSLVGDFTSTTLLTVEPRGEAGLVDWARGLQRRLWEDLDHRYFSGVEVVRELGRLHQRAPRAATPVVFTSTLGMGGGAAPALDVPGEMVFSLSQTPQVLLDHQVAERDGGLDYSWDAVDAAFPPGLLDDMFAAYERLLHWLVDGEDLARLVPADLSGEAQVERRAAANATEAPLPPGLLHEPFVERARLDPARTAVVAEDGTLTYGEVLERAGAVAGALREMGARPGTLVGVVMEKGWQQIVGVQAVLLAGAAYLPVDAALPTERVHQLLAEGEVELALTTAELLDRLDWPDGVAALAVDAEPAAAAPPPDSRQAPDDLAYVIFTSGSTGRPKGVMIEHRAALNTVVDLNRRFAVGETDRVLALSSLSFDLSVYDVFGLLAAGGALVVPGPGAAREPGRWIELAEREGVTVWNSVPALMELAVEHLERTGGRLPAGLRLVLLSGDWIPVDLPGRIRALAAGADDAGREIEVISLGGATEASIWSIVFPIGEVPPEWSSIPYGRPLANQTFHVLDGAMREVPDWVTGELYIGGAGVARGYWRDPQRTAESFVHHPETGERLYRTGDLGRYLPSGDIEFLGRADQQVKLQGHRVELGEIEFHLEAHPAVRAAVADVRGKAALERRLVGYVVSEEGGEPADDELRRHLASHLPAYMVPALFVRIAEVPLTANGKVDRRALPEPGAAAAEARPAGEAPRSDVEARVAELFAQALEVERVGIHDDFFALGGNSVAAILLISRLREAFESDLPLERLLSRPTVAAVAEAVVEEQMAGVEADELEEMFAELEDLSDEEVRRLLAEESESPT